MPSSTVKSPLAAVLERAKESQQGTAKAAAEATEPAGDAAPRAPAKRRQTPRNRPAPPKRRASKPAKPPRTGRPATGKRSDPEFASTSVWLRRTTLLDVDIELRRDRLENPELGDRSDLVEQLLLNWLKRRGK